MEHLKLNQHKFKKGKFISPWNDMDFKMTQNPWFQNRLPEYLWLALILNKYDRKDVTNRLCKYMESEDYKEIPKVNRLVLGLKTLEEVPERLRAEVEAELEGDE